MRLIFFAKCSKPGVEFESLEKNWEYFFGFEIIAFEFVALKTHFYWERILVIRSQYVNKESHNCRYYWNRTFKLKFFQSDWKIWKDYCRADLSSISDPLTCWLSISLLTRGFLGILVTTHFTGYEAQLCAQNVGNLIEVSEMQKKIEKTFSIL